MTRVSSEAIELPDNITDSEDFMERRIEQDIFSKIPEDEWPYDLDPKTRQTIRRLRGKYLQLESERSAMTKAQRRKLNNIIQFRPRPE